MGKRTNKREQRDKEPSPSSGLKRGDESVGESKRQGALRGLQRQLEPKDLSNPGVQKMILSHIDSMEFDLSELREFKDKFHRADKELAISSEKLKTNVVNEIFFAFSLAAGSALIGVTPSIWGQKPEYLSPLLLAVGAVLMVGAILGRIIRK